jgi:hypothetical protein
VICQKVFFLHRKTDILFLILKELALLLAKTSLSSLSKICGIPVSIGAHCKKLISESPLTFMADKFPATESQFCNF